MALLLTFLTLPPAASAQGASAPAEMEESLQYRWHLGSLLGVLAGLFLPDEGSAELIYEPAEGGRLRTELTITSEHSDSGEYWRYGSVIDPATGGTVSAWSSYRWRGKEKSRQQEVEEASVVGVASAIYLLRRDPPDKPRRMEIWSDGKTYPVVAIPLPDETRRLDGREVTVRHLSIRGVRMAGRRFWKGKLDLWLARDEAATPVEILIERSLASVRLKLQSG